MSVPTNPCPCGSGDTYAGCCGRYHVGSATAPTAERLMRARYSAFAVGDMDYLMATWHRDTRPIALRNDPGQRWTGLDVLGHIGGGLFDVEGTVRFRAHYVAQGEPGVLSEDSRFLREAGRWWYVEPA